MKIFPTKTVCDVLGIARSNIYQNRRPRPKRYRMKDDERVLAEIKEVAKDRRPMVFFARREC